MLIIRSVGRVFRRHKTRKSFTFFPLVIGTDFLFYPFVPDKNLLLFQRKNIDDALFSVRCSVFCTTHLHNFHLFFSTQLPNNLDYHLWMFTFFHTNSFSIQIHLIPWYIAKKSKLLKLFVRRRECNRYLRSHGFITKSQSRNWKLVVALRLGHNFHLNRTEFTCEKLGSKRKPILLVFYSMISAMFSGLYTYTYTFVYHVKIYAWIWRENDAFTHADFM